MGGNIDSSRLDGPFLEVVKILLLLFSRKEIRKEKDRGKEKQKKQREKRSIYKMHIFSKISIKMI